MNVLTSFFKPAAAETVPVLPSSHFESCFKARAELVRSQELRHAAEQSASSGNFAAMEEADKTLRACDRKEGRIVNDLIVCCVNLSEENLARTNGTIRRFLVAFCPDSEALD